MPYHVEVKLMIIQLKMLPDIKSIPLLLHMVLPCFRVIFKPSNIEIT